MKRCKSFIAFLIILLIGALTGCSSDGPEATVHKFWNALMAGNTEEAANFVSQDMVSPSLLNQLWPDNDDLLMADGNTELFLQRISLTTVGHQIEGQTATVDVIITWPHLGQFLTSFLAEGLGTAFAMTLEGASQEEIDTALVPIFIAVLAKTPDVTTEHQVTLVLEEEEWKLTTSPLPNASEVFDLPNFD